MWAYVSVGPRDRRCCSNAIFEAYAKCREEESEKEEEGENKCLEEYGILGAVEMDSEDTNDQRTGLGSTTTATTYSSQCDKT